jgi:hypothetical protein
MGESRGVARVGRDRNELARHALSSEKRRPVGCEPVAILKRSIHLREVSWPDQDFYNLPTVDRVSVSYPYRSCQLLILPESDLPSNMPEGV